MQLLEFRNKYLILINWLLIQLFELLLCELFNLIVNLINNILLYKQANN